MGNPYDIPDDDPEYQALLKQYGVGAPQAPQQEAGFKSAFKNALGSQVQGAGQIAADLGWQDNPIERYGKSVQDANPMSIRSLGDIVESPWQATKEATGMALGYIAPAMVGRGLQLAGGAMKMAGLSKAGVALNTLPAQAALAAVPSYGGIREEQEAGGHNDLADIGMAALGAGTVGAIETKFGAQKMLGLGKGAVAAPTRAEFVKGLGKTPLATMGKVMGRTVAEEMGEELAQNPIEQLASYQNPLTAENINETLTGSALAGLGTIGLGGAGGARMAMRHKGINDFRQQDLLNPNTPLDMLNDQAEWNKAFIERDDGATAADRFYRQRQGEIDQYIENLVDPYRREAFADDMRQIDLLADQERIAARAPSVLGRVSDYNPDDERVANAVDRPNAADYLNWWEGVPDPTNPEAYQQFWQHVTDGTDSVRPVQRDALGYPLSPYQPVSATQPQASAPSWTQYGVEPTVNQGGANVTPQVAQGSNQAPRGNTGGSAGNTSDQSGVGRGRDNVAGTPMGRGGANQLVGSTSGGVGAVTARPGTKDALKQMAVQLAPEGSQEYVDLVNAIDTSKSYAEARKSLAKHSKDGLRLAIATAPEQDRKTLQLALGWDNEGNMVGSTIPSYSEIGKQIGKTRQRVQQILSQYGITEQVLNQMAAVGQESVGLSEIMPSQQEDGGQHEGTGYRLMTNPNEADDIVDDHQTRKDTQEANRVAAEMGVSAKELSQPSNFQTAAEVRAEEIAQANREAHAAKERERTDVPVTDIDQVEMRQLRWFDHRGMPIKEEDIEEAAMEYDGVVNRLGGSEQFYDMPEAEQLRVVKNYIGYMDDAINAKQFKDFLKGIFNEREKQLEAEAARQREAEEKADVQRLPGRDGEGTNVEQTAEAADQAEDAGTEEGLTPQDISAAWNALAEENNLPKFADLLDDQRQALLEAYDEESLQSAANVVAQEVQDEAGAAKFSESNTDKGVDPQKLSTTLRKLFFSPEKFNKLVSIYPDAASIPLDVKEAAAADAHMSVKDVPWEHVQGFAMNGKVYLVAGNIKEGNELGVFLHELGVHVGMERLIGKSNMAKLSGQIEQWAANDNGSKESKLAKDAVRRAEGSASEDRQQEVIAYFVEEAVKSGINPVAVQKTNSPLAQWFRSLWAAAKLALRKIGLGRFDQLSAQNIVDLSYGAAKMELTGTWHGTQVGANRDKVKFSQADVTRINPQYRQASTLVKQVLEYVGNKFQSVENNLMFGHQLAEKLQRLMPGTDSYIKSLQKRQTERVKHEQEIARIASAYNELDTKQQNALNAFVQKSTMDGKWGFKPTWFEKDVTTTVDPTMKTQFDALTPAAQQIIKDMFKFGSEQQKRFDESVNANITDPKKKVQRNQMYGKPYAPLKRFGDHVVVGKSAAFVAEEKANPGSKRLAEMKADPKHYYVEFTDGNWEAIKRRDEMASANPALSWLSKPLQLEDGDLVGMNFTMLEKLKRQIEASDSKSSKATKSALSSLANQLYIQQLNHLHANKSQAQRLNVKGADTDMMRAFVTQGRAEAALIANLRTHAETEKALQQIQTAAREGSNQDAKTRVANAVLRRHLAMLDFKPTPIQNKLMGANSFMMLLTSPAYYLTNATQPFVVSLPYMAGRFGGANSWNTLRDAYKTTLELVKLPTLFKDQNLDTAHLRKFNSIGREADALQTLLDENLVNVGMEMELGDIANQSKNPAWKHVQKGMQVLKTGVANVEILNRLSSAVAGYRLAYTEAINKGQSTDAAHDAGVEYARKLVIDTHGDYAGYNAPTVMMQGAFGNLPVKLMTQFKKFQFIQAGLLIGTFRDAYLRGNLNSTEKAAAKAMFKWMLGTQAALAGALGGVTGVPMALLGSILAGAFGDDGEDKEAFLRRVLGGGAFAQLILHGAPAAAGVDISKRVGMGAALDPFRMADPQTDWSDYALSLAGPSAGLASRTANGLGYMGKGQYWKGLEMLMPSGVLTNASKIARYESEGLTNSRGDVVMKPEEISLMTDIMQGMGLETTQLSDRRWKAGAVYDRGIHFKEQTAKLQRDYVEAIKDGDQGEVSEIRQKWMKLQAERVKQGFKRENMTALTQAPMAQKKRERDTINGLQSTQTNKKFVESIDAL